MLCIISLCTMHACLQTNAKVKANNEPMVVETFFLNEKGDTIRRVEISEEEWKKQLAGPAFHVRRIYDKPLPPCACHVSCQKFPAHEFYQPVHRNSAILYLNQIWFRM